MWPNPQKNVDLVTFTGEILNGKFYFCVVQEPEGLKGVYDFKFFYLDEDQNSFFTQWYATGKEVTA